MFLAATCLPLRRPSARLLPGLALATLLLAPSRADAQDVVCDNTGDFPCSYQIKDLKLQKVPPVFKFQARVSQAKLPIGEGLFTTVYVKLLRGTEVLCSEQFQGVQVVDSVLNLEIGRNMSCELDEVMAENSDLAFQICPGDVNNCLKPVELGSAPYAVKASFASLAQQAHHANVAGQASYAHRVTADRDLLIRNVLGIGYFDFYTPVAAKALELFPDPADFAAYENGGFLQWTPVKDRDAMHLSVVGKRHDSDQMTELDTLHLFSEDTTLTGDVTVTPSVGGKGLTVTAQGAHIIGNTDVDGTVVITQGTTVQSGGVHVTDDSNIDGALVIARATTVQSGGADITGNSQVLGTMLISQALTVQAGGAHITGASEIAGTLLISAAATVAAGGIHVTGNSEIGGTLDVGDAVTIDQGGLNVSAGGVRVSSGGVSVSSGGLVVSAGGADITGDSRVAGRLDVQELRASGSIEVGANIAVKDQLGASHRLFAVQGTALAVNPDASLAKTDVNGVIHFHGPAIFDAGVTDPVAADTFIFATGETRNLTFGGDLTVAGQVAFPNGLIGGLAISGGLAVDGTVAIPGGITGALTIGGATTITSGGANITGNSAVTGNFGATGNLTVGGTSTLTGAVAMPGGVTGALGITGAVTAGGGVTAGGNGSFGGTLAVTGTSTFTGAATFNGGISGNMAFGGALTVAGNTSLSGTLTVVGQSNLAHVVVSSGIAVNGVSSFGDTVSFPSGITGNTNFTNSITVGGTTTMSGNANVGGGLVVTGATQLLGTVSFGGGFSGTTQFQHVSTSGNLTVAGLATFSGLVAFPGGITGSITMDTLTVDTALVGNGSAVFNGPVDFNGSVTGLDNLSAYVKASGENRGITLPSLVITGNTTLQGTLTVSGGFGNITATALTVQNNATLQGNLNVTGDSTMAGGLSVAGVFNASNCCICLNYSDNDGTNPGDHKYTCVKMQDGSGGGSMHLSGAVDDNDVVWMKFVCGASCTSGTGAGWK